MSKNYPTCTYILTKGTLCQSPALNGDDFCYYHHRDRQRKDNLQQARELKCSDQFYKYPMQQELLNPEIIESLDIPSLDDGPSIQVAVTNIVRAVLSGHVSDKKAGLALFGCQIAAGNLARVHLDVYNADHVPTTDTHPIQPFLQTKPHPAGYMDDLKAARKLIDAAQKLNQSTCHSERREEPASPVVSPTCHSERSEEPASPAAQPPDRAPSNRPGVGRLVGNNERVTDKKPVTSSPSAVRETGNGKPETVLTARPTPKTFAQHIKLAAALHQGHIDAEAFKKEQKLEKQNNAQHNGTQST